MEKNDYVLFDEQVDKFLRHQMTSAEENEFRNLLATNPELKERAQTTALMIKEMLIAGKQQDQALVSEIKEMSESEFRNVAGLKPGTKPHVNLRLERKVCASICEDHCPTDKIYNRDNTVTGTESGTETHRTILKFVKYAAAACVAGALVIGGYKYLDFRQTVSLGNSQYLAYVQAISEIGNTRGSADEAVVDELQHLFDNVHESKDLGQTIKELELLYQKSLNEDSDYYYFDNDIAWNLAIAYLKDGDKKKPVPILERMVERNKDYREIWQPAQNLLDQINRL